MKPLAVSPLCVWFGHMTHDRLHMFVESMYMRSGRGTRRVWPVVYDSHLTGANACGCSNESDYALYSENDRLAASEVKLTPMSWLLASPAPGGNYLTCLRADQGIAQLTQRLEA